MTKPQFLGLKEPRAYGKNILNEIEQKNQSRKVDWLAALQKDLDSGISSPENAERIRRNIERCQKRIAEYQERLKDYKLQKPCYASNCYGTSIIENTDLCSHCKEHCEAELLPNVITDI